MKTAEIVKLADGASRVSPYIFDLVRHQVMRAVKETQENKRLVKAIVEQMRVDSGKFNKIRGLDKLAR
jgi:hypothetical protein